LAARSTRAYRQPAAALYIRRPGDFEYRWLSLVAVLLVIYGLKQLAQDGLGWRGLAVGAVHAGRGWPSG